MQQRSSGTPCAAVFLFRRVPPRPLRCCRFPARTAVPHAATNGAGGPGLLRTIRLSMTNIAHRIRGPERRRISLPANELRPAIHRQPPHEPKARGRHATEVVYCTAPPRESRRMGFSRDYSETVGWVKQTLALVGRRSRAESESCLSAQFKVGSVCEAPPGVPRPSSPLKKPVQRGFEPELGGR